MPPPSDRPFSKATDAEITARVDEVLNLMLAGASRADILRYSSETSEPGQPGTVRPWGVTTRQIENYMARAHDLLEAQAEKDRDKLYRLHMARRETLYARAVSSGDIRSAHAVLRDTDEMLNLYPAKAVEITGKDGQPMVVKVLREASMDEL
jgi:hypothetical protein